MPAPAQPVFQVFLMFCEVRVADTELLKTQFLAPCLDAPGEFGELCLGEGEFCGRIQTRL